MNEELRIQRVKQYGSFLYCPMRGNLCFGRYTDGECVYDSCILDDPDYQELKRTIESNRQKQRRNQTKDTKTFIPPSRSQTRGRDADTWDEIHAIEKRAAELYRKNKPKIADGLMADAMFMRRRLISNGKKGND